jgi:hypothetical protein
MDVSLTPNLGVRRLASTSRSTTKSVRDVRLDFFRGGALLCIFINHIPGNIFSRLTYGYFGFSDAAEVFVLLAGLSLGQSQAIRAHAIQPMLTRVVRLYVVNAILLVAAATIAAVAAGILSQHAVVTAHFKTGIYFPASMFEVMQSLLLVRQPEYFDILPLYIALFVWLPVFVQLCRRSIGLALLCSIAIWCGANYFSINLPSLRDGGWFFNPLAWQLLFSVGILWGATLREVHPQDQIISSNLLTVLAAVYIIFGLLLSAPWAQYPALSLGDLGMSSRTLIGPDGKTYLSLWRLTHILCIAYVAKQIVKRDAHWLGTWPARRIVRLGQQSLRGFFVVSLLSFICSMLMLSVERTVSLHFFINVVGICLIFKCCNTTLWSKLERASCFAALRRHVAQVFSWGEVQCGVGLRPQSNFLSVFAHTSMDRSPRFSERWIWTRQSDAGCMRGWQLQCGSEELSYSGIERRPRW